MGAIQSGINYKLHPDETPFARNYSKFDPLMGFPDGREEKVMKVTDEELYSARIPLDKRDYCAHMLLAFQKCRREVFPWVYKCHHDRHAYLTCEAEEYTNRMKDYERERRLMLREKRISAKA